MKLAYISHAPVPYHTPVLNELSRLIDLHVIYMSGGEPIANFRNPWGTEPIYKHEYHGSIPLWSKGSDFRTQVSIGVSLRLRRVAADVVMFNSWSPIVWEPLLWAKLAGKPAVMWGESTAFSGLMRGRVSNMVRRTILANTDAFVSNGTGAASYLESLGATAERIVVSRLPSHLRTPSLEELLDCPRHVTGQRFLFVGRLVQRKRPLELLQAFQAQLPAMPSATLSFVGDGPLEHELRRRARATPDNVQLLGRLEGEALLDVYRNSDVLVIPSVQEVWGLVVNEAIASGLYVISTDQVGSALDLVDSETGAIVPADNPLALQAALLSAAKEARFDREARALRAEKMRYCTPDRFAADVMKAIDLATCKPSIRADIRAA